MRVLLFGFASIALAVHTASSQTAEFKCPSPGTTVEFTGGPIVIWLYQDGKICKRSAKRVGLPAIIQNWYAPAAMIGTEGNPGPNCYSTFAEETKPWRLWPLVVGKQIVSHLYCGQKPDADTRPQESTLSVDSHETVSTKAGTFEVFVVTHLRRDVGSYWWSLKTDWYAPAVGVVVKTTDSDSDASYSSIEAFAIRQR